ARPPGHLARGLSRRAPHPLLGVDGPGVGGASEGLRGRCRARETGLPGAACGGRADRIGHSRVRVRRAPVRRAVPRASARPRRSPSSGPADDPARGTDGLAWRIGVSRNAVGGYEVGTVAPSAATLNRIAMAGRVTGDWLLRGDRTRVTTVPCRDPAWTAAVTL